MSTIFTVNSHTNNDEYDNQSTYTETIGVFDNHQSANQAAADAYFRRYLEYVECMEEDVAGFGKQFGVTLDTTLGYEYDVETFIKVHDPSEVFAFFKREGGTIWPSEMGSCTQTFLVEISELEVQSAFYLTNEQQRTNFFEGYVDVYELAPNNEELDRYIHYKRLASLTAPNFVPNQDNCISEHNILDSEDAPSFP